MATYKVWLTVKDSYGNTKEIEGGTINVDLFDKLTQEDLAKIDEKFATDAELAQATHNTLKYADFELRGDEGGTS